MEPQRYSNWLNNPKCASTIVAIIKEFLGYFRMAKTLQQFRKETRHFEASQQQTIWEQPEDAEHSLMGLSAFQSSDNSVQPDSLLNSTRCILPQNPGETKFGTSCETSSQFQNPILTNLLETYMLSQQPKQKLPKYRKKIQPLGNELWLIRSNGKYIAVVDNHANMKIILNCQITAIKSKAHSKSITQLRWHPGQDLLATAGMDARIKIWDHNLALVREFKDSAAAVYALVFFQKYLISGGDDKQIRFYRIDNGQKKSVKAKTIVGMAIDSKRRELITLSESKCGRVINFISMENYQETRYILRKDLILAMEANQSQRQLLVSTKRKKINPKIYCYGLQNLDVLRIFQGHKQENFLLRMQLSPKHGMLAVGSECGQILIYHLSQENPILTLKTKKSSVVNAVTWVSCSQLACACDNGDLEIWVQLLLLQVSQQNAQIKPQSKLKPLQAFLGYDDEMPFQQ